MAKVKHFVLRLESGNFLTNDSIINVESPDLFLSRRFDYAHQAYMEQAKHKNSQVFQIGLRPKIPWC